MWHNTDGPTPAGDITEKLVNSQFVGRKNAPSFPAYSYPGNSPAGGAFATSLCDAEELLANLLPFGMDMVKARYEDSFSI